MRLFVSVCFLVCFFTLAAQQVKLDNLNSNFDKKNILNINGGLSATANYIIGNQNSESNLFNYFFNGNLNIKIANLINLPFTFTLTNSGSNMAYPMLPNRFSLHPSYKWVTMHIGDISMNFSPYTLNGHQFTGIGVDFTPAGNFKGSVMYGRLQRKVEYAGLSTQTSAAYQRMGHGAKLRYDNKSLYIGSSYLYAHDDPNSLTWKPDSLNILPQKNTAINWEFGIKPLKNLQLSGEYAISLLTRDTRAESRKNNFIDRILGLQTSTSNYDAYKFNLGYQVNKSNLGLGYERISAGYKTLGTYYSNNDLENITINISTILFKDRLNVSSSLGLEHNDLENSNDRKTSRLVGSLNMTYNPTKKVNIVGTYSNFQTHSNAKSQFDYINQTSPTENLDTLNFVQLSQNTTFSIMYQVEQSKTRMQSLNLNINYQTASDKQGAVVSQDNSTSMTNAACTYNVQFIPQNLNLNTSFNVTNNQVGLNHTIMFGPSISTTARFFEKTISTGISSSYNMSFKDGNLENSIFNARCNLGYVFAKKHNFMLSGMYLTRKTLIQLSKHTYNFTATYSYNF